MFHNCVFTILRNHTLSSMHLKHWVPNQLVWSLLNAHSVSVRTASSVGNVFCTCFWCGFVLATWILMWHFGSVPNLLNDLKSADLHVARACKKNHMLAPSQIPSFKSFEKSNGFHSRTGFASFLDAHARRKMLFSNKPNSHAPWAARHECNL